MSESVKHVVREIYCEVLFELAEESGLIDRVQDDLQRVRAVLQAEPEFAALMDSPALRGQDKSESIRRVFQGHISDLALDFLSVLARRGRMSFLEGISDRYEAMVDHYHDRQTVEVTVAAPLSGEEADRLRREISEAVRGEVKLSVQVDPDLIGGVIIKKDDTVVDNSIRSALKRAARRVAESAQGAGRPTKKTDKTP
ncbi:MAG TPA: ATP synthase F1 subunit delta [Phycisphaerales bacterium]|nr:ATP synthase F1 subunit delta [Phycisphaerales bacterium]